MLNNLLVRDALRLAARKRKDRWSHRTVKLGEADQLLNEGWAITRKGVRTVRLSKEKRPADYLEDRLWHLLYVMGFPLLSGSGGVLLGETSQRPTDQLDAVAIDDEVCVFGECKWVGSSNTRVNYSEVLGRLHSLRNRIAREVREIVDGDSRKMAPVLVVAGTIPNDEAYSRADELGVGLLTELDIAYYEQLTSHLGEAARYQFMADLLPGKQVPNLRLRLPAVRAKMGGVNCYSFSIRPSHLLKIAYISHRMKGRASDVTTYQRMVNKGRLEALRRYISDDGVFPTNIVVNLSEPPQFDLATQEESNGDGRLGWITLRPNYKSAWIIDGQHRLFAYSGHQNSGRDRLSVVAFDQLDPALQAELFVKINGEQKSVKKAHLNEMFAELHWNSDVPRTRAKAVISKTVQSLGVANTDSPFFGRIHSSEEARSNRKSVSTGALFDALSHSPLFLSFKKGSKNIAFGPCWIEADNDHMVKRARFVLDAWFSAIREASFDWWELGRGAGGGLSMNDSVVAHIDVIWKVFEHLRNKEARDWLSASDSDLVEWLSPFAQIAAQYLGSFTENERLAYRAPNGSQGQTLRSKRIQLAIREKIPAFDPGDLDAFEESQRSLNSQRAKQLLDRFELLIQKAVFDVLKDEYTEGEDWWWEGVSENTRAEAIVRMNRDKASRGGPEHYLDLSDYRSIVHRNWQIMGSTFTIGSTSQSKEQRTEWMKKLIDWRNVTAHPSSGKVVSGEEIAIIEEWWLQIESKVELA